MPPTGTCPFIHDNFHIPTCMSSTFRAKGSFPKPKVVGVMVRFVKFPLAMLLSMSSLLLVVYHLLMSQHWLFHNNCQGPCLRLAGVANPYFFTQLTPWHGCILVFAIKLGNAIYIDVGRTHVEYFIPGQVVYIIENDLYVCALLFWP